MAATVTATARAASQVKAARKDLAAKVADRAAKAVVTDAATAVGGVDGVAQTVKAAPSASALTPKGSPWQPTSVCRPVDPRKQALTPIARSSAPIAAPATTAVIAVTVATGQAVAANAATALNAASPAQTARPTQRPWAKATARVAMKASPVKAVVGAVDADATDVARARTTLPAQQVTPASRPNWDSRTTSTPQALRRMMRNPRKTEMPQRKSLGSTMARPVRSAHVTAMAVNAGHVVNAASARIGPICAFLRSPWRPKRATCKRQWCPQRLSPLL